MKNLILLGVVSAFFGPWHVSAQQTNRVPEWKLALPGWEYIFPRDHAVHPDFKTEWWYFTGNLQNDQGRAYGYELTFFRQGVLPPGKRPVTVSEEVAKTRARFVQSDLKFAHFAISDIAGSKFAFEQKTSRGAFGEAGFGASPESDVPDRRLAWIDDWSLEPQKDGAWRIVARTTTVPPMSINLTVASRKPPAIEGTDGVSQKADGLGNASHYYSLTRLQTTGVLTFGPGSAITPIHGESWFDHEWASNQLASNQVGWNWFSFQFDDRTELMLYAMRRNDGSVDPASSGTLVDANGTTEHLRRDQFQLRQVKSWHSQQTGADYPVEWQISIPSHGMEFTVHARLENQELVLPGISYWEGAILASGQRNRLALRGLGYMELTGYAGALKGLQQQVDKNAGLRGPPR